MNEQTSIVVSEATPLAVAGPASESQQVMDLFRRAFEGGGATPEALAQLVDLKERVDRRNAELEFARALARFQEQCPPIPRTTLVDYVTKAGGVVKYRSADFEQIVETCGPPLRANGFSITFDMRAEQGGLVTTTCTLRHVNGHSAQSSATIPSASNNPGMSDQQKWSGANTFAKRISLISVLGLSLTDPDPDNEGDGGTISDEQVATLEALLQEVGADRARFLVYLRVADLHDLKASGYKAAVTALEAKRRAS